MKKTIFLFVIFAALLLSLAFKKSTVNTFPLFGYLIVLDPGHGGLDPGAVFNDDYEKDYNLEFAKTLKSELERKGASVIMTREADYDLSSRENHRKKSDFDNRILLIDDLRADLYISLHMNYLKETKYYGAQVFYSERSTNNKLLGNKIQDELNKFLSLNKKVKKISDDKYMYNKINTTGILIEFGFISSEKDKENLKKDSYKKELADTIIKGLLNFTM